MYYKSPLTYVLTFLFIVIIFCNFTVAKEQQFVLLAKSFKAGSLSFINIHNPSDTALYNNKLYWPHGPFPALVILPFLYLTDHFYQAYISAPLIFLTFLIFYKLARHLNLEHKKSLLLATFFVFGSIYTPTAALPATSYYSQALAACLLILSIYEFLKRKGYLLSGIFFACAVACRFNIIFGTIFFVYLLYRQKQLSLPLLKFLTPIIVAVTLLGLYNYTRFGSFLDTGYNLQIIAQDPLLRRNVGLFSIKHIPANLYYMLLKGPSPIFENQSHVLKFPYITFDSYGLSLFFMSPILFTVFKTNLKKTLNKASLMAIFLILIPIITYYGIGTKQLGYRYALDFFPFVYLLTAAAAKNVSYKLLTILVFWGVIITIYFTFMYLFGFEHFFPNAPY